jgi:hypothetical protein
MELSTEQIFGIIISIIVLIILKYWLASKIKTKRTTFSYIEKGNKKANEFTQSIIDDVDKVLSELKLSARKDNSIFFHTHEAQTIHYSDLDLVISTDAWHMAILRYDDGEIIIHSREIKRQEKIKNFFLSINPQEMTYKQIA